jgi:hypothetical protein
MSMIDNSHDNYSTSNNMVKDFSIKYICDHYMTLGIRQKSAKYNQQELVHQNKQNVSTTGTFKIQP